MLAMLAGPTVPAPYLQTLFLSLDVNFINPPVVWLTISSDSSGEGQ